MSEEKPDPLDLVNFAQFSMIASMFGSEFDALLAEFFADCGRFAEALESRVSAGDIAGLGDICHEIKGAAAQLGLSGIARRAAEWEEIKHPEVLAGLTSIKTTFLELTEQTRLHLPTLS